MHRLLAAAVAAALILAPGAAIAAERAQAIETEHFRFHAAPGTHRNTARLAAGAEERFDRLCHMIGACDALDEPIEVWLAEDATGFARVFPDGSPMAEWAVGVAFPDEQRIVLRAHGSALFTLHETFDHEVSHVLVRAKVGDHVPRWLSEGIAIWQAGEAVLQRLVDAQRAAVTDNLLPLEDLDRRFPARGKAVTLAYAQAALFVHWLEQEHGVGALPALLDHLGRGKDVHEAFEAAYGASLDGLEEEWREAIAHGSAGSTLLGDPNLMWSLMSLLFLWAAVITWRRRREQMRALAREEAREDAVVWTDPDEAPTLH
ncbi:MAG: peptidase MA family metallohydrolase [Myxococcota bacterium]